MTLYEFNQAGYANLPTMTQQEIDVARIKVIETYLNSHVSHYYMLLNNEKHYYTIFTFKEHFDPVALSEEVISIAQDLGEIKSIESKDGVSIEFWIKDEDTSNVYYLFDYSQGVIEV